MNENLTRSLIKAFAGSGVVGKACLNKNRLCVLVEKAKTKVMKIVKRLDLTPYIPKAMTAV